MIKNCFLLHILDYPVRLGMLIFNNQKELVEVLSNLDKVNLKMNIHGPGINVYCAKQQIGTLKSCPVKKVPSTSY